MATVTAKPRTVVGFSNTPQGLPARCHVGHRMAQHWVPQRVGLRQKTCHPPRGTSDVDSRPSSPSCRRGRHSGTTPMVPECRPSDGHRRLRAAKDDSRATLLWCQRDNRHYSCRSRSCFLAFSRRGLPLGQTVFCLYMHAQTRDRNSANAPSPMAFIA
jgi:hypothetical protein